MDVDFHEYEYPKERNMVIETKRLGSADPERDWKVTIDTLSQSAEAYGPTEEIAIGHAILKNVFRSINVIRNDMATQCGAKR